jgi:hypothetical protein
MAWKEMIYTGFYSTKMRKKRIYKNMKWGKWRDLFQWLIQVSTMKVDLWISNSSKTKTYIKLVFEMEAKV